VLHWHFVDHVWIFLYPLLYLVDHHGRTTPGPVRVRVRVHRAHARRHLALVARSGVDYEMRSRTPAAVQQPQQLLPVQAASQSR
jgi:hypothetical protein